jgi:hypothetical protein
MIDSSDVAAQWVNRASYGKSASTARMFALFARV